MRWAARVVVTLVSASVGAGCSVGVEPCDEANPCSDGYVCEREVCVPSGEATDAGPDDDSGAPDGGVPDGGTTDAGPDDSGAPDDGGGDPGPLDAGVGEWWDHDWPYRVDVVFSAGSRARSDHPVDVELNLPALLDEDDGPFDERSVRVVEHDEAGRVLAEVPSYFHFDAESGDGIVFFALRGDTPAGGERRYGIYFADGNAKEAPPYWQSRVQPIASSSVLEVGMGYAGPVSGSRSALSLMRFGPPGGTSLLYSRPVKIRSSGGDYGSRSSEIGAVSANLLSPEHLPTRRLHMGDGELFEEVATAGPLRLRELNWVGRERMVRQVLRVQNLGDEPITDVRFFAVVDGDIGSSFVDDRAAYVEADDIVYVSDTEVSGYNHIGVRGTERSESHTVNMLDTVLQQTRAGALLGGASISGDVAVAVAWALPDLAPGEVATLRYQLAYGDSYGQLRTALLNYADVPAMTMSGLLRANEPAAPTGPPQILDFVVSPSVQYGEPATLLWTTRAASACRLMGPDFDETLPPRGALGIVPSVGFGEEASFTLLCSGSGGADAEVTRRVAVAGSYRAHSASDLAALAGVSSIPRLRIDFSELSDLSGLSALTTVSGDLHITDNRSLRSLTGLGGLVSVGGGLYIQRNPMLPTCATDELVARVTVSGTTRVRDTNANGTCP